MNCKHDLLDGKKTLQTKFNFLFKLVWINCYFVFCLIPVLKLVLLEDQLCVHALKLTDHFDIKTDRLWQLCETQREVQLLRDRKLTLNTINDSHSKSKFNEGRKFVFTAENLNMRTFRNLKIKQMSLIILWNRRIKDYIFILTIFKRAWNGQVDMYYVKLRKLTRGYCTNPGKMRVASFLTNHTRAYLPQSLSDLSTRVCSAILFRVVGGTWHVLTYSWWSYMCI